MRSTLVSLLCLSAALLAGTAVAGDKKVLMFSRSHGYQHDVVKRGKAGELSLAEKTVTSLGKELGFDVIATKDGTKVNASNLKNFDAVFFFTQGDLNKPGVDGQPPMSDDDRPAILEYVKAGGGFVGTHCGGADTFHGWQEGDKKPFLDMVGGEFIGHGAQQETKVEVVNDKFPAVAGWPKNFTLNDEWYAYHGFHKNLHVLMMLQTEGMKGDLYQRPAYPITWCSNYGKGRVFYTGLGHRDDVWTNPLYQKMVGQAVLWSLGKVEGDASPNIEKLFGNVDAALKRINPPGKK